MRMPPLTPRAGAEAKEDDTFPLITAPSPSQWIPNPAPSQRSPSRRWTTKAVLCAVLIGSVGSCLYFVERASLVLQTSEAKPATRVHAEAVATATAQAQALRVAPEVTDSGVTTSPPPLVAVFDVLTDGDYSEYSCVGWRQTGGCTHDGPREPNNDKPCDVRVYGGASGFCEIEHRTTGARRRVLPRHCTSLPKKSGFECNSFSDLLTYGRKAVHYKHDRNFSYTKNQNDLLQTNNLDAAPHASFFERGIAMVIYEELVLSAYASVRWMRQQGLSLPIEMWYRRSETDPNHPLLLVLVANYSVYLREFEDPLATGFYTKLHAVFYSAFDSVLLLDADNFAVRDPSFLFESREFTSSGALFWPDFWKPDNTLFNVHNKSLVWEVFDLPFVDMFEQESGQVLINRRRHMKALNALMYYGFTLPRIHEELRLVWGDKDLFRFAWMKTGSSFEMVSRPPGSAGKADGTTGAFCGLTMVQHDALGEVLFLHRNMHKIREASREAVWTHVEQFKRESPLSEYRIGWAKVFKDFPSCWGKSTEWEAHFTLESMADVGLGEMEPALLRYADDGVTLKKAMKAHRSSRA